jgi:GNAT superfamily N-acetyltransferase
MIRRAVITDMDAIFQVHTTTVQGIAQQYYSPAQIAVWSGRKSPEIYATNLSNKIVIVDGEACIVRGFGQLDLTTSTIEAVYVAPVCLRHGVGSRLLAALESIASASGAVSVTLDASLNSVPFYENAGYSRVADSSHELCASISIPCVVMQKCLLSAA